MEEALALIERIIEEHRVIKKRVQNLERVANDASVLLELEKSKEGFMPGRFDQREGLQKLAASLEIIDKGLKEHFDREEEGLLAAFEKHGERELASALRSLLLEHEGVKNRLAHSKKQVAELAGGGLSRQEWEATAYDMRAHVSHTRKLLEAHAENEQELLRKLRNRLLGGK